MEEIIERRHSKPWLAIAIIFYIMATICVEATFIILKVCGVIAWSWGAVFIPFIIMGIVAFAFMLFLVCCAVLITAEYRNEEKESDIRAGVNNK
jgi:uncharacterized membrane protein